MTNAENKATPKYNSTEKSVFDLENKLINCNQNVTLSKVPIKPDKKTVVLWFEYIADKEKHPNTRAEHTIPKRKRKVKNLNENKYKDL